MYSDFFVVFVGVSVGITFVYVLFLWRHRCSLTWSFHTTEKTTLGLSMYLLLLWVFVGLLTIFTSIIQNIDAVIYYLPMAKAIVQTSGLTYNPFYLSQIAMTYPPTLPLMYAFQLFFTGDIHMRFIPPWVLCFDESCDLQAREQVGSPPFGSHGDDR